MEFGCVQSVYKIFWRRKWWNWGSDLMESIRRRAWDLDYWDWRGSKRVAMACSTVDIFLISFFVIV